MKVFHVAQKKKNSGGSWKNECAPVNKKNTTKPKSNKHRASSERS